MKCSNCNNKVIYKRTLKTLFKKLDVDSMLCHNCLKLLNSKIYYFVVPSNYGRVFVIKLFSDRISIKNYQAFMPYLNLVFKWFVKYQNDVLLVLFDEIDFQILDCLSDLYGDILVVTFKQKKLKEEGYEI